MLEAMAYFERAMVILDSMAETEANRRRRVSLIVNQWIVFWLLLRVPEYYDLLTRNRDAATALGEPGSLHVFSRTLVIAKGCSGCSIKLLKHSSTQ